MHPILFHVFGLPIHAYGFMIMVGFLVAIHVATRRARTVGIEEQHVYDLSLAAMLCGVAGARLWYVVQYGDQFDSFWDAFKIWEGGIVFHGGFFGGVLGAIVLMKRRRLPILKTADVMTPSIPIGLALGRLGCFLNGCCWGGVCADTFPLAVRYPYGSPAHVEYVGRGLLNATATHSPGLHPSQIYSSVLGLVLFFLLTAIYRRRRQHGEVFAAFFFFYGVDRFILEMFRDDTPLYYGLTSGQWTSLFLFGVGLVGWIVLRRRGLHRERAWAEELGIAT